MLRSLLTAAAVLATSAYAQTETNCNPLNSTCPADPALGINNYTWDATQLAQQGVNPTLWNNPGGITPTFDSSTGMTFTISQAGNAPTLNTTFYYFFGQVSVLMKAASGTGIISSIVSLSDDLDEIDWEFKGGNKTAGFTNFYGKPYPGMLGKSLDVDLSFDPTADYHNYTTVWTNQTLQWLVDGNVVRTVTNGSPETQNGFRYPQTPMVVKIGNWAGGGPGQPAGTVTWAGGATDFSQAPFNMQIKSVFVNDYSSGSTYTYDGHACMSENIQISGAANSSVAAQAIFSQQDASPTISQRIANLSPAAKTGIAIAAISVAALGVIIMTVCCIKQRRAGRKERAIADAEFQKQEAELMAYRMQQQNRRPGQMPGFGYNDFKGKR